MRKHILLMLLILVLAPLLGAVIIQAAPAAEVQSCASVSGQASPAPGPDSILSLQRKELAPVTTCGSSFCTDKQRLQCDRTCAHHKFFVGLECCTDTCTTICNCGSVPINC